MKLNALPCDVAAITDLPDMESVADVRHQIRYPLRAPVSFTWFSREGAQRDAKGNSRNIGEGGAYVLARKCPEVGAQIILVFRFPHLPASARTHRLEMSGQVVRTDALPKSKGMCGFAVASSWTILQESEDSESSSWDAE
jgi:hypothetical protein